MNQGNVVIKQDGDGAIDLGPYGEMLFVESPPRDQWQMRLNTHFTVTQPTRPNAWWRFWQWALLGWTWEKL